MLTRIDAWLLAILHEQKADSFIVAMSIDEIIEAGAEGTARITIYKHIRSLLKKGYVATGAKNNRASCFYITDKGKALLNIVEGSGESD